MSSIVVVHEHSGREGRGVGACKKPVKTSTTIIIIIWGRGLVEMMPPYMAIYACMCTFCCFCPSKNIINFASGDVRFVALLEHDFT